MLRKKWIISTVAASLAASAFAGIPLSSKGLAEKAGFASVAFASAASVTTDTQLDDLFAELQTYYEALKSVEGGIQAAVAARADLVAILNENPAILAPVTDKLNLTPADKAVFRALFEDAASVDLSSIEAADWQGYLDRLQDKYGGFLNGLDSSINDLTVSDVVQVVLALQANVFDLIGDLDIESADDLLDLSDSQKDALKTAVSDAVNSNAKVKAVFTHYEIGYSDVAQVGQNLRDNLNFSTLRNVRNALNAFIAAYNKVNGDDDGDGEIIIGGGGGDLGGIELPKSVTAFESEMEGLAAKLAAASPAEKAALLAEAVKKAQAIVDSLSNVNAAKYVSINNGQAVLKLDDEAIGSILAGLGKVNEVLKSLGVTGAELPKLSLKLDLGSGLPNSVAANLSDDLVKAAIANGVTEVQVVENGLKASLPLGGELNGAISFGVQTHQADPAVTGGLQSASGVYDFTLAVNGKPVTSFSTPIVVSIPLGSLDGLDQELLSVAKIVDGKLLFQGGRVQGHSIVEARDTFSSYVVVENKVTFSDIASVEAWAGRAIQVIAAKGAIEGKSEGVFAPKDQITRAEFAKMLIRAFDLENGAAKENFNDVNSGDWFASYVAAAAKLGIINGRTATEFAPNATITRAEMATMIARTLKAVQGSAAAVNTDNVLAQFADASSISSALKDGVAYAASQGIVEGSGGKFRPKDSATRAEAAAMIYRAYTSAE
ncbi:S-layer homology domain-containing protein [Paenibacillus protaetiae]|nr:S-layer homology domain-containing protein [Paenibacillus protaetiae]